MYVVKAIWKVKLNIFFCVLARLLEPNYWVWLVNVNIALLLQRSGVLSLAYIKELVLTSIFVCTATIIMLWIAAFFSCSEPPSQNFSVISVGPSKLNLYEHVITWINSEFLAFMSQVNTTNGNTELSHLYSLGAWSKGLWEGGGGLLSFGHVLIQSSRLWLFPSNALAHRIVHACMQSFHLDSTLLWLMQTAINICFPWILAYLFNCFLW